MFSIESRALHLKYYESIHFLVYGVPFLIASSLSSGNKFTLPRNMPYDVTSVQMQWLAAETLAYNSVSQSEPTTFPAEGGREVYLAPWAINHLLNFYVRLWASVISGWALERVKAATSASPDSTPCLLHHWRQCSSATRELDCLPVKTETLISEQTQQWDKDGEVAGEATPSESEAGNRVPRKATVFLLKIFV